MDPAVIGARLASSAVAPLIKKLFVTEGPGAGMVDKPVRISGLVSFKGEKRTLTEKDLHKLASELVRRALRSAGPEERPIPADEELAVADALARTLHALGDLDMDDIQLVLIGHQALAGRLRSLSGAWNPSGNLSADATTLYSGLLNTACLHILHFFTQRSTFVTRTLVEQSGRLGDLIAKMDVLIERVPRQSAQDAAFEHRYAEHIGRKHGRLTIYGLDLNHTREWPLDTAYLTLRADPTDGLQQAAAPAEQALAGHHRVLLRGVAGSGKTTLVQWLAVCAAQQDVNGRMDYLIGRVPFVIPLRTVTRNGGDLPTPGEFLAAVGCPVAGAQPPGWADQVLAAGRGLLLIDGIDEIPDQDRERTRRWLRDLVEAFPGNLWLVTSRPSAVREDWLAADGFTELSLSPMSRDDVAAFIQRWHTAADADPSYEQALLTAVRTKQDLGRLATNPLMCGLICALHRERRGYLPHGRAELYDAALSMLLERRDRERDMHTTEAIQLTKEPQIQLLQKLAYWMIRNGRSEMAQQDAVELLTSALPSMPHIAAQGSPPEIFRHLLLRSGLLREPTPGSVDFIHRTFQDYLGAKAAVEERDFDYLIANAHLDQWADVIRLAVAHARPAERARILTGLLEAEAKQDDPQLSIRHTLLAAACLEHATELDPAVRAEVTARTAAHLPPRDNQQARDLAEIGPMVLDLLPGPEELSDAEAKAIVVTATRIGTDAAIPVLARFREHPSLDVRRQLAWSWHRFDTERYAEEIIARLPAESLFFTAMNLEHLRVLHALGGRERLQLLSAESPGDIVRNVDRDRLEQLWLSEDYASMSDFGWLSVFPRLRTLYLMHPPDEQGILATAPPAVKVIAGPADAPSREA
ncbi:NACHT domain-containing protein [Streptomyces sp. H27-D2]|uniref:NACHT domain-containing protein n=1 Tax=Streptomyces sp. H27-D2 TaxID=3046304 RepID=UPI002DBDA201|nr:NACHT domain-containing protein [Streptomyces sp. H27-D2]MEC4016865.1 NACHT domain-containing protein [Streptomyces sp. H27-D2]